ncbi:fatty acid-binding protein, heart-like [Galleria mellonella]|uniref:Fatty acid-binding protein, heart-like n=1 Tax=Galleria mellonella TaxID=7137 RepID=A0A6J3BVB4_GALME|nr:fatty acid-binding protein, heart-like [Galleria mellonella]
MEEFLGKKYMMTYEENLAEYLSFLGINKSSQSFFIRVEMVFSLHRASNGSYFFKASSQFGDYELSFKPGEEFDDFDFDFRKGRCVITIDGHTMTMIQRSGNGKISKSVMEYYPDKLIVTTTALGFKKIVKRQYTVVQ